ncbi:hypothetical protein [Acinetobacter brisouii]|jgi:hypothetical protein|uniref:hypothetical protein n=1 Tax=Acinetobacter brisouii TaxID=396323 RepID=UPI0035B4D190
MRGKAGSNIGISCVGATSFTELAGDSDGVILNGITAVELDGTLYPFTTKATDLPATISIQQKRRKKYAENGVDYNWQYYIVISNLDTVEHRVKLIGYNEQGIGSAGDLAVNPTLGVDVDGNTYFCLSVSIQTTEG